MSLLHQNSSVADGLPVTWPNKEGSTSGGTRIEWGGSGSSAGDESGGGGGGGGGGSGGTTKARQGSRGVGRLFNAAGLKSPSRRSGGDSEDDGDKEESKYIAQHRRNFQQSQQRLRVEVAMAAAPWEGASEAQRKSAGVCVHVCRCVCVSVLVQMLCMGSRLRREITTARVLQRSSCKLPDHLLRMHCLPGVCPLGFRRRRPTHHRAAGGGGELHGGVGGATAEQVGWVPDKDRPAHARAGGTAFDFSARAGSSRRVNESG
jgi:hypothetical protein